jgi:hypothetical protein
MTDVPNEPSIPLDPTKRRRYWIYALLIVVSLGSLCIRICNVKSKFGFTAMLSANDRSRWCTIRALVDNGTYLIDDILEEKVVINEDLPPYRNWWTIDLVRHRGNDGREHYYSSKPPLYPTLLAWEYWAIKNLTGKTIAAEPLFVMRTMLILTHVPLLLVYFLCIIGLVERIGSSDEAKLLVVLAATLATYVTTFGVTLNNHLIAAVCVMYVVYCVTLIWRNESSSWYSYAAAGFFAAFTAANELPALSFLAAISVALLYKSWWRTLGFYAPAAAIVIISFFSTTHDAHGTFKPPYMHRSDGKLLLVSKTVDPDVFPDLSQVDSPTKKTYELPPPLRSALEHLELSPVAVMGLRPMQRGWFIWDRVGHNRYAMNLNDENHVEIRHWANWYEYNRSYWTSSNRTGVDLGEKSRKVYAFNATFGSYGIFSLTPIWLPAFIGMLMLLIYPQHQMRGFATMVLLLTLVCFSFYIARPEIDRNYGGVSCCFRWMIWFTPMWLVCLIPAADALCKSKSGKMFLLLLIALSSASASFGWLNPWQHPWLYQLLN